MTSIAVAELGATLSWSRNQCQQVLRVVQDLETEVADLRRQLAEERATINALHTVITAYAGSRDE